VFFLKTAETIYSTVTEAWPVGRMATGNRRRVQETEWRK